MTTLGRAPLFRGGHSATQGCLPVKTVAVLKFRLDEVLGGTQ